MQENSRGLRVLYLIHGLFFKSPGETGITKMAIVGGKLTVSLSQRMVRMVKSNFGQFLAVSEGLTVRPIMLDVFMNHLNSGTAYALSRVVGGTK